MQFSRRSMLGGLAALGAAGAATSAGCAPRPPALPPRSLPDGAFPWGVMSGDPQPDSMSLWTRIRPGAASSGPVNVVWQVSANESFTDIAAQGTVTTDADRDHSVKVTAKDLDPDRRWFYRFNAEGAASVGSAVGHGLTAPAPGSSPDRLRIAFLSCQMYSEGYFSAYRHVLDDDVDFVLHLGDYIYEYGSASEEYGLNRLRLDPTDQPKTVAEFRSKYHLYRTDPDLVECHRQLPFVAMWDDHEIYDDYDRTVDPELRAAGYQAWFENMPYTADERDPTRIHRSLRWGDLVDLYLMDLAQYRDPEAPAPFLSTSPEGAVAHQRNRTMLGGRQFADVKDWFSASKADWRLLGNPQMLKQLRLLDLDTPALRALQPDLVRNAGLYLNGSQWDGYQRERQSLLDHIARSNAADNIILTGDIHSWWAGPVSQDIDDPNASVLAAEFVGSSITSPGFDYYMSTSLPFLNEPIKQALGSFDYVNLFDHGYGICEITPDSTEIEFRKVDITDPGAGVEMLAKFRVDRGDTAINRVY